LFPQTVRVALTDRTTMEFGKSQDEIKLYLDACYVSTCEGFWHITQSIMHQELPHIVPLQCKGNLTILRRILYLDLAKGNPK
jgi:hypothetical protein